MSPTKIWSSTIIKRFALKLSKYILSIIAPRLQIIKAIEIMFRWFSKRKVKHLMENPIGISRLSLQWGQGVFSALQACHSIFIGQKSRQTRNEGGSLTLGIENFNMQTISWNNIVISIFSTKIAIYIAGEQAWKFHETLHTKRKLGYRICNKFWGFANFNLS